jgi:regulator of protease activity HflC (stomatin/prohibitin superfamily)
VAGLRDLNHPYWLPFILALLLEPWPLLSFGGFFTLQPNEARVLILFGSYRGTVRTPGFHWGNPFYANGSAQAGGRAGELELSKVATHRSATGESARKKPRRYKISLRARNFNSEKLKVNDKRGNPIEIAAVVVWRVEDTAQAVFDVEDFENYVRVQSESALRHLASGYAYDHGEEDEVTLRSGVEEVSQALKQELQMRLEKAGVLVEEARLTHLAYAPEIAQAMLRRQQAEAVIAARTKIVHGAVSMVDMALKELAEKRVVELDDDKRASMVSNLMVVLCGESEVHPVVNAGTLYS